MAEEPTTDTPPDDPGSPWPPSYWAVATARPWHVRAHAGRWALLLLVATVVYLALGQSHRHYSDNPLTCCRNLGKIGQAICVYAPSPGDRLPDRLEDLLGDPRYDLQPSDLVCPSSHDTPTTGPTTQALRDALSSGGHCSYVYLGKGQSGHTATARVLIAYEAVPNHSEERRVCLFGDGHVEMLSPEKFEQCRAAALAARPAAHP